MNTNRLHNEGGRRTMSGALRRMLPAVIILLGMTLLTAGVSLAVPQIAASYGGQMGWFSAEVNAMGGTGAALYRGGFSTVFNPALLSRAAAYRLDAGLVLDQEHEDRFQPLFDSFDSYVTDAAIASNRNHYFATGFALAGRPGGEESPFGAGLSLTDRYPFDYTFTEELRNPSPYPPGTGDPARDMIIEERAREVSGTLRDLSVGVGYKASDRLSLGAAAHYAFGTRTEVMRDRDFVTPENSYHHQSDFDLDGVNFTLGAQGVVSEHLEIGVAWESKLSATGDWTQTDYEASTDETTETMSDAYFKYPQAFRAGLTFRPQTDPRTVFTMELEYKTWSDMEDWRVPGDDNPQHLEDTTDVRIGLQHSFYNGMDARFGFRHYESYLDKEATASVFSAGVGAPFGSGMFSASVELAKVTSIQAHQFPYPTSYFGDSFVVDPMARVEDTRFRIGAGYKVEF